MARILMRVSTLLMVILSVSACGVEPVLPDTQLRAPGILQDNGFGLGSGGGVNALPPGGELDPAPEAVACDGGFGLGSGGKSDECPTAPTS